MYTHFKFKRVELMVYNVVEQNIHHVILSLYGYLVVFKAFEARKTRRTLYWHNLDAPKITYGIL